MHVKFADLPVKDQDRAVAFYTDNLGMSVGQDSSYGEDAWRWIELTMEGAQTKILLSKSTASIRPESPTLAFIVDDVESLYQRLVAAGVDIKQKPQTAQWNPSETSALFYDSEDNLILITSTDTDDST